MPPSLRLVGRVIATSCLLLLVGWLASGVGVLVWSHRDDAAGDARNTAADAIVVLGAAQYEGRPSPVLKARLDHAIDLHRRRLAPVLVVTGGRGYGDTTTEAAVSQRYATKRGVSPDAILLEDQGRTTSESMRAVSGMLETSSASPRRVILVSDPFHMLRLAVLARRFSLDPATSPTRTSPISANRAEAFKYVLSESVKVPLAFILERRGP
jgi:uncharacterized SAM-binding protein YcdF (DUF218 family)